MMFANGICAACGYDGPENPLSSTDYALTPADAHGRARRHRWPAFDSKVNYVQDEELGKSAGGEGMGSGPCLGALMAMARPGTWPTTRLRFCNPM